MEIINVSRIIEDRREFDVFYEDELVIGIVSPIQLDSGHVVILPKKECSTIDELDYETFIHMNFLASNCSTVIFEALGMHGTNLVFYDGKSSNNIFDRPAIHIVGRLNKDNIHLKWDPKKPGDLKEIASKIKDQTFFIGKEKKEEKIAEEKKPVEKKIEESKIIDKKEDNQSEKDNYLIRQLIRIP